MKLDRTALILLVVGFAIGHWLAGNPAPHNVPTDRPVVRWIARAAKNLLWVALLAEKGPEETHNEPQLVHARIGEDGQPLLDHGKGW